MVELANLERFAQGVVGVAKFQDATQSLS